MVCFFSRSLSSSSSLDMMPLISCSVHFSSDSIDEFRKLMRKSCSTCRGETGLEEALLEGLGSRLP